MIEHFKNRPDFLYYRHVTYEPAPKKRAETSPLNIVKIVEKYRPNPGIPANDDVAEIHYMLAKSRIKVVYQLEKERVTASTIEYKTPPIAADQSVILTYNPDEIYVYQVRLANKLLEVGSKRFVTYLMCVKLGGPLSEAC